MDREDITHCGFCLPCLVRRLALKRAGVDDPQKLYAYDVFQAAEEGVLARLEVGERWAEADVLLWAEADVLLKFAQGLKKLDEWEFYQRYADSLVHLDPLDNYEQLSKTHVMMQRFAEDVLEYLGGHVVKKSKLGFSALSVRQPWAYLIVMGQKTIELRTWSTRYRGLLLIHAARKIDEPAINWLGLQVSDQDTGCLVGAVELVDVIKMTPHTLRQTQREHRSCGPFSRDMYGFVLEAPQVFSEPIRISGSLGIFGVTRSDEAAVRKQLRTGLGAA